MNDKNILNIIRLLIGAYLMSLYVLYDKNGTIVLLAAFMLGLPIEVLFTKALLKKETITDQ